MKNIIKRLEEKLINSDETFETFDNQLWLFLCSKEKKELKEISKELEIKGKFTSDTNIANIRLEIIKKLNIEFLIN